MGTRPIDSIQSQQIDYLEADIYELETKLNLLVDDINALTPKLNTSITNLINVITGLRGTGYSGGASGDGLFKRLTEFDDYYTEHISSKFPPMVDIKGIPRIGYTSGGEMIPTTHKAGDEDQMFSDGWECQDGTCLAATITSRLTGIDPLPAYLYNVTLSNLRFMPADHGFQSNDTFWRTWNWPICEVTLSSGNVTSSNFEWEPGGSASHPNNSHGFGWSVNDTMHSGFGPNTPYPYNPTTPPYDPEHHRWFNATVTSVGSQCRNVPSTNAGTLRSPATEYAWNPYYVSRGHADFNGHLGFYGDDSPGIGGIAEPTPPAAGSNSETSTHNIMDETDTEDEDDFNATVVDASTLHSYPNQEQILFLDDESKVARAQKMVRKTLNKLRSK